MEALMPAAAGRYAEYDLPESWNDTGRKEYDLPVFERKDFLRISPTGSFPRFFLWQWLLLQSSTCLPYGYPVKFFRIRKWLLHSRQRGGIPNSWPACRIEGQKSLVNI